MNQRQSRPALDLLLVVMVVTWGGNYSLIKAVLPELPPRVFNGLRLLIASVVYLTIVAWALARGLRRDHDPGDAAPAGRRLVRTLGVSALTRGDWGRILVTGLVGHFLYQVAFIEGLSRTTVSNAALLIGASPIAVSVASAVAGHDRLGRAHWAGLALSFLGVYLIVGRAATIDGAALSGDALILAAVACWATYTVVTRPLLERHSPLYVTALSMTVGTAVFVPYAWADFKALDWTGVPGWAWAGVAVSALTALNLAYLIWYVAVQRLGAARTSVWSNVIPLVGMLVAWAALGERITLLQVAGAALILSGVITTRLASIQRASDPPPEE